MANLCIFYLYITGKEKNVNELVEILNNSYSYNCEPNDPPHMFKIEGIIEYEREHIKEDIISVYIGGQCAWDIESCMLNDGYYSGCKKEDCFEHCNATTMEIETKRLGLAVEIYSDLADERIMEHHIIANGNVVKCGQTEYEEYVLADYDSVEELNADTGEEWTEEKFNKWKEDDEVYVVNGFDLDFRDCEDLYKEYIEGVVE